MGESDHKKRISTAKIVAFIGVMAATLECAKLALSFLPNIEIVTLLTALYSYVFGIYGLIASVVFVSIIILKKEKIKPLFSQNT